MYKERDPLHDPPRDPMMLLIDSSWGRALWWLAARWRKVVFWFGVILLLVGVLVLSPRVWPLLVGPAALALHAVQRRQAANDARRAHRTTTRSGNKVVQEAQDAQAAALSTQDDTQPLNEPPTSQDARRTRLDALGKWDD